MFDLLVNKNYRSKRTKSFQISQELRRNDFSNVEDIKRKIKVFILKQDECSYPATCFLICL